MLARIGIVQGLNRYHVREFNSDRKPHHWGRRKPADRTERKRSEQLELARFSLDHDRTNATFLKSVIDDRPQHRLVHEVHVVSFVEQ